MASKNQAFADKSDSRMEPLKRACAALIKGVHTLSPNCCEASRLQSESLDPPLSWPKRLGLRLHLLICKWCRRYGKQVRFLRQAVHEHPQELNEAETRILSAEARERLKHSLRHDPK
jgi:hypothetical protein